MKTIAIAALLALTQAIDLQVLSSNQAGVKTLTMITDGPTNGEMSEDEKDTLIQVLCPGVVVVDVDVARFLESCPPHGTFSTHLGYKKERWFWDEK